MEQQTSEEKRKAMIIKFSGFDDIGDDSDITDQNVTEIGQETEKKKKKGGKKRKKRPATTVQAENKTNWKVEISAPNTLKHTKTSRLLQELHDRERVHGMSRVEARQLVQDKLLFLGDNVLKNVRFRRFCLVLTSKTTFDLGNGTRIPSEIVSVSMDNGKINSILRFFPTYTKTFEMEAVEEYQKSRMKRVYWNPSVMRDANLMCRTWSHFLERCLHSQILVPLDEQKALLDFLRTINEIRSVLNNRSTVSICLNRVVSVDDFLISVQNVIGTNINADPIPVQNGAETMDFAIEFCRYFLQSMNKIFMTATLNGNSIMAPKEFLYKPRESYENRYYEPKPAEYDENYAPTAFNTDSEAYRRIVQWVSSIDLSANSEGESHEKNEEEEETMSLNGTLSDSEMQNWLNE